MTNTSCVSNSTREQDFRGNIANARVEPQNSSENVLRIPVTKKYLSIYIYIYIYSLQFLSKIIYSDSFQDGMEATSHKDFIN